MVATSGACSFTRPPSKDLSNGGQFIQIHVYMITLDILGVGTYIPRLAGEEDVGAFIVSEVRSAAAAAAARGGGGNGNCGGEAGGGVNVIDSSWYI